MRLVYRVEPASERCPDRAAFVRAVRDLLGHDPFDARAPRHIEARLGPAAGGLRAYVILREVDGRVGRRTLVARRGECRELGRALALAVSLAADPLAMSCAKPRGARLATAPRVPPRLRVGLAGRASFGVAPNVAWGPELSLSLRWPHASVGLAGQFDAATAQKDVPGGGGVASSFWGGALFACGHWSKLFGCGVARGGGLRGEGRGLVVSRSVWLPHVGLGVRAGLEWSLPWRLHLSGYGEILGAVVGVELTDDDSVVLWRSSSLTGAAGLAIAREFF